LIQIVEEEKFCQIFSDNNKSAQLTTLAYAKGQWSKKRCNYAVTKPHKITKYLPAGTLLLFRMDLPHQGYGYKQSNYRVYSPLEAIGKQKNLAKGRCLHN
jgi:hypothetical protein